MRKAITIAMAATAALLALGCGGSAFQLFGQVCMDVLNNGASVDVSYLCELP